MLIRKKSKNDHQNSRFVGHFGISLHWGYTVIVRDECVCVKCKYLAVNPSRWNHL